MGMIHLLASLVLTLLLWNPSPAQAEMKHKRGQGLLGEKPDPSSKPASPQSKPAAGTPKPGTVSTEGHRPVDLTTPLPGAPGSGAETDAATAAVDCRSPGWLEKIFAVSPARLPETAPEGAYFLRTEKGVGRVFRQSTRDQAPVELPTVANVEEFRASPDRKMLWVLSPLTGSRRPLSLWRGEGHGVEEVSAPEAHVTSAVWTEDGLALLYTANGRTPFDFDLYRYDLATKTSKLLAPLNGFHEVRDVSPDGKSVALVRSQSKHVGQWLTWQEGQSLVKWDRPVDPLAAEAVFAADSKSLYFLAVGTTGRTQLFNGTPATAAIKPLRTENGDVEHLRASADRKTILFTVNDHGYSRVGGWMMDEKGSMRSTPRLPGRFNGVVEDGPAVLKGGHDDFVQFFFTRSTAEDPSQLWFWNGNSEEAWFGGNEFARSKACALSGSEVLVPLKTVAAPLPGFASLPGYLYVPRGAGKETPFVLYLTDGPDTAFRPGFSADVQYLVARGFGVLALNPRGSHGYGKEYESADNGAARTTASIDLVTAREWLAKERGNGALPVFVLGRGARGWMVGQVFQTRPEAFRAGVVLAGVWDPAAWLAGMPPVRKRLEQMEWEGTPKLAPTHARLLKIAKDEGLASLREAVAFFEERNVALKR